jgi:hypothetical protein
MKNSYALRITAAVLFLTVLVGLAPRLATAQGSGISVTIPKVDPEPNTTATLSITADLGDNEVRTLTNLEFTFDPSVVEVEAVRNGDDLNFGSSSFQVSTDNNAGTIRISNIADNPPISGAGEILEIDVRLEQDAATSFELTPSSVPVGDPPTSVFITPRPEEDVLPIETINQGQVGNEPPSVGVTVPDQTLQTPAPPLQVRGLDAALFSDPDGNQLTYEASSSNPSVLAVTGESDEGVTLQPQATGTADVTVTALDIFDASASTTVTVTVEERSPEADEPIAQTATVLAPAADGVPIDTDAAGVVLRGASISGSGIAKVDRFDTAPDGTDGIGEGSVSSYRAVLSTSSGLDLGAQSEVRFPVTDFSGIATPDDVVVYLRSTPRSGTFSALPTSVDDGSTTGDPTDDAVVGETESQIAGGELVLASTDDALPVELADFSVVTNGSTAQLEWTTASETNNAGFEIQHRPPQASQYRESGFMESKAPGGTSTEPHTYRYAVKDLSSGTHRFRLRQVDIDGETSLSEPIRAEVRVERTLTLSSARPNPVRRASRSTFTVRKDGAATVALYNVLGQKVRTLFERSVVPGRTYEVRLSGQSLPSGTYFLQLAAPSGTKTRQVAIVK